MERAAELLHWAHLAVVACSPILGVMGFALARHEAWFLVGASVVALPAVLWSYVLLRRGYVQVAGIVLCVVALLLVTGVGLLGEGSMQPLSVAGLVAIVFLAGLLVGWRGALWFGILSLLSVLGSSAASLAHADRAAIVGRTAWGSVASTVGAIVLTTVVSGHLARRFGLSPEPAPQPEGEAWSGEVDLRAVNESLARRVDLMRGAVGLSSEFAPLAEPDEIARRASQLVCELLQAEWAGLFLCEVSSAAHGGEEASEGAQVVVAAAAGRIDAALALPGEQIALGNSPALALCIRDARPQVTGPGRLRLDVPAQDVAPVPGSLVLLPLRVGQAVLGVLALYASRGDADDDGYVEVGQVAADQIAASLHRARAQTSLRSATALAERAVQRHIESSWDAVVASGSSATGYKYTPRRARADDTAWLPPMADAVRDAVLVVTETASDTVLAAPLVYNSIVIGALGLRRPVAQPWTQEERLLVQSVSEQVTQALENRRLFEFARDRAQRERVLRRITERIRAQADLDGALAAAAQEMRELTDATQVAIRLARPSELENVVRRSGRRDDSGEWGSPAS